MSNDIEIQSQVKSVIAQEYKALLELSNMVDESWTKAVNLIRDCKGKIILAGVGKSGNIARKIAASFTSTGTPSIFIHPTEASHGDLGLLNGQDIIVALSASGKTAELLDLMRYAKHKNIPQILITKKPFSSLTKLANIILKIPDSPEACINGLAPTTSTTCQLVCGDALVVAVMSLRRFTAKDFKSYHPAGNLGTLLIPVKDFMYKGDKVPLTDVQSSIKKAIIEMNSKSLGCVGIINHRRQYIGIFTDGDLRRCLESQVPLEESVSQYMTPSPLSISPNILMSELVEFFREKKVPNVFVIQDKTPVGIVHVNQLTSVSGVAGLALNDTI